MTNDFSNDNNYLRNTNDNDEYSCCNSCPYYYRNIPPNGAFPPQMNAPKGGPPGPPPTFSPNKNETPTVKSVSPGSIRPCVFRYVYIWLENDMSFWAWLTRVDMRTASGWRWNRGRWVYFGVDLRRISSFECY